MKQIAVIALLSLGMASASTTRVFEVEGLQYVNLWDFTFNHQGIIATGYDTDLYWSATIGNQSVLFKNNSAAVISDGASVTLTQPVKYLANMPYVLTDDLQKIFQKSVENPQVTAYQNTFLVGSKAVPAATVSTSSASAAPVTKRVCKSGQIIQNKVIYTAQLTDENVFAIDINNMTNDIIIIDWGNTLFVSPAGYSYDVSSFAGSTVADRIAPNSKFNASLSAAMLTSSQSKANPFASSANGKGTFSLYLFTSTGRMDLKVNCETKTQ